MMLRKLYLLGLLLLSSVAQAREGGEIGNAFVPFENFLGGYRIEYPKSWTRLDIAAVTSFQEKAEDPRAGFLSVLSDRFEGVKTQADLHRFVTFFHPGLQWQRITLQGLEGLEALDGDNRIIYLVRKKEQLVSLRYPESAGEKARAEIAAMVNSLRFF